MTILSSLARAYERLPDAPPYGFSSEKIGFIISLNEDGTVANVIDWREGEGKKARPRLMAVPQAVKRTAGISPNFLWDKTSYVLGVTAGEGKRTAEEHRAFVERHLEAIGDTADAGLRALRAFLESWQPDSFIAPLWPEEMKDQNVVFALESERRGGTYLHDRPAARALWARLAEAGDDAGGEVCLVSGDERAIARLHPSIKGVWGAQSSGAALVSFNLDAFTSYGHEQGDNAPVSTAAAFAYTTALNRFLERDSGHRMQIGDASTVFWADAADLDAARLSEALFASFYDGDDTAAKEDEEKAVRERVSVQLGRIRQGLPLSQIDPALTKDVRFYILGLAPNAARISVRFFYADSFGALVTNYQRFIEDMRIEPPPREGYPAIWRYLQETAVLGKRENVPPNLAGEWMRAILSGNRFPLTLLSAVLTRIRADGRIDALRASMLRGLLIRNFNREVPVAFDPANENKGYLLGRLFAVYEQIQVAALGRNLNAGIRDKYYGSASAQPRKVFALLDSGAANHLSKIGKQRPGQRVNLEKQVAAIMALMSPGADPFPTTLGADEQALFGLGYYHQRNEFFNRTDAAVASGEDA